MKLPPVSQNSFQNLHLVSGEAGSDAGKQPAHHKLITEDLVRNCLRADKGQGAVLQSFEVRDFTKKGDNYMTIVTSVFVQYRKDEKDHSISYVVKLNPQRAMAALNNALELIFTKETGFYKEISPALNKQLELTGQPGLRVAHSPYARTKKGEEAVIMEDLRGRGFKMVDRLEGLDDKHCLLVIKELARFHAASLLYKEKEDPDILGKFPFLFEPWMKADLTPQEKQDEETFGKFTSSNIDAVIQIATHLGKYEKVIDYLRKLNVDCLQTYKAALAPKEPFGVITHGDCWSNNILFRYDENGSPVEVMLVDLQILRYASPTLDINYLLFTSLQGKYRREYVDMYLREYYSVIEEVLHAGGCEVPFTSEELRRDYESNNVFGFLSAACILPIIMDSSGKVFDVENMEDDNLDEILKESQGHILDKLKNPLVKTRFVYLFEDIAESISKSCSAYRMVSRFTTQVNSKTCRWYFTASCPLFPAARVSSKQLTLDTKTQRGLPSLGTSWSGVLVEYSAGSPDYPLENFASRVSHYCGLIQLVSGRSPSSSGEGLGESPTNNSLITKELVEACLRADKGQEAKLLGFREEEFTKKGDNFMCVVTSVSVRYKVGTLEDRCTSYVIKSNPQPGLSDTNKLLDESFRKEYGFYHGLGPALNRELQEVGLPGLRTPRSPFAQITQGKEIIFMDNLRDRGFQMTDFRKGLDKEHSLLVVMELARLHGASFLLQRKSKVDLLTSYPYLVDVFMREDEEHENFSVLYRGLLESCAAVARLSEGYGQVAKFLEELSLKPMDLVREHLQPRPPFVAVVHGDSWSNNLLFRKDDDGVPVEMMFVDLQDVRASSPTTDLSFFFFTSLSGQVRRKNMDYFLQTYYDTLQDVVRTGGLELSFTLGTSAKSTSVTASVLCERVTWAKFQDRVFKMSGEAGSDAGEQAAHHKLITEDLVQKCLRADKGEDAVLLSFEVKDFTKKGENFMCIVTSVFVRYREGDQDSAVSYVVKLNPQRSLSLLNNCQNEVFTREGGFYNGICPILNKYLRLTGAPDLRVARSPHVHLKEGEEALFLEDLRVRGFRMQDRVVGLDEPHCLLVLKELARLHGASMLYKEKEDVNLLDEFPFLIESWLEESYPIDHPEDDATMNAFLASSVEGFIQVAAHLGGYDELLEQLKNVQDKVSALLREEMKMAEPFLAVAHGDCWTNNILFRYDERGCPIEVMLVDLQVTRFCSPTLDLNYFLYTSTKGEDRKKNLSRYLEFYYSRLEDVLRGGGCEIPFTLEEMRRDYEEHKLFGFLMAMFVLPIILSNEGEAFDVDTMNDDNVDEMMKGSSSNMIKMLDNPLIENKFVLLLEEMAKYAWK
ncbi:uncharacterized protein LOC143039817 [Oratosquilla oratoria]|uniref:uncharacterized protein LOC143039817 n=1 Tax=Oratosquilla oratoria TaxID=337810 RepID=UPI003F777CA4